MILLLKRSSQIKIFKQNETVNKEVAVSQLLQYLFQVFQLWAKVVALPVARLAKPQKSVYAHLFFALLYHGEMGFISFTAKIEDDF